jgi:hypothetical protein
MRCFPVFLKAHPVAPRINVFHIAQHQHPVSAPVIGHRLVIIMGYRLWRKIAIWFHMLHLPLHLALEPLVDAMAKSNCTSS